MTASDLVGTVILGGVVAAILAVVCCCIWLVSLGATAFLSSSCKAIDFFQRYKDAPFVLLLPATNGQSLPLPQTVARTLCCLFRRFQLADGPKRNDRIRRQTALGLGRVAVVVVGGGIGGCADNGIGSPDQLRADPIRSKHTHQSSQLTCCGGLLMMSMLLLLLLRLSLQSLRSFLVLSRRRCGSGACVCAATMTNALPCRRRCCELSQRKNRSKYGPFCAHISAQPRETEKRNTTQTAMTMTTMAIIANRLFLFAL